MSYSILDIVSPQLKELLDLKPIETDQVIEFRHVRANKPDPRSTKKISSPQAHILPGRDIIQDPYDKKNSKKLIMNVTGYNPIQEVGRPMIMDPIASSVTFGPTGSIFCTEFDSEQMYFLRLHNKNGSNPNRIVKGKNVVFNEVNEVKELTTKNNYFEYRTLAGAVIMKADETDGDDGIIDIAVKLMRAYPAHYNFDLKQDISKIKASITFVAEKQPLDFILAVKEPKSFTRVLVDDAIERNQIWFDDHVEKQAWCWKRKPAEKGAKKVIIKTEGVKNPLAALIEYLQTAEGSEHLHELKQLREESVAKPR